MSLTCLDILNIHYRLSHLSKNWYLWHSANIYYIVCLFLGTIFLFWANWPLPPPEPHSWNRPYEVGSIIILVEQMRKLRHAEVI